jgi:hypothetical protein
VPAIDVRIPNGLRQAQQQAAQFQGQQALQQQQTGCSSQPLQQQQSLEQPQLPAPAAALAGSMQNLQTLLFPSPRDGSAPPTSFSATVPAGPLPLFALRLFAHGHALLRRVLCRERCAHDVRVCASERV